MRLIFHTLFVFALAVKFANTIIPTIARPTAFAADSGAFIKSNQPAYSNTFDVSSGGASLTRATQEGVLFANPSLMAFGPGYFRWIFFRQGFHVGSKAAKTILDVSKKSKTKLSSSDSAALANKALSTPIHVGVDTALGIIFSNAGFAFFQSSKVDLEGRKFGAEGVPEMRTNAQILGGGVLSAAKQFGDVFALGATVKGIGNGQFSKSLSLGELQAGKSNLQNELSAGLKKGRGIGGDIGSTLQFRSRVFDVRIANVVTDVGNTKFSGNISPWKQTLNSGLGLTLHNDSNALHCAIDYRDVLGAYKEHWTKRIYTGCKGLLFSHLGVGAGLYQGWPSFGIVANLILMRMEIGRYTREFGKQVGSNPREIYYVTFAFEI